MASRKEEKERLRAERLAAERSQADAQRRRAMLGYVGAGVLVAIIVAGIVVAIASSGGGGSASGDNPLAAHIDLSVGSQNNVPPDDRTGTPPPPIKQADLQTAAKDAGCKLTLNLPDYGHQHVKPGTTVNYKGEPPTSGNHVFPPLQQADGAYSKEPDPLDFVHSLEHARVEYEYAPNLPESQQLAIKGVFDESPSGVLMFPNGQLTDQVAAAAWRNRMNCPRYRGSKTLDALRDFRDKFRGVAGREFGFPITP